ncbi:MAG: imidazolonepropionase [Ignavibacteriales bacterium]|nr:imidazolonepropionase [Ignavibacteriales bacterium]
MSLALINIKQLVTVSAKGDRAKIGKSMQDLGIIENAAVLIDNSTIKWIGRMENLSMSSLKDTDVLDCFNKIVLPGFIDSHTHLVFAGSRENEFAMRSSGATYQEIAARGGGILSTVNSVRQTPKKELKKTARKYLNQLLQHGTTTVEIKSGYGLDADNEIKMLEAITELNSEEVISIVSTFLGAHAIPPEYFGNKDGYVKLIIEKMLPYIGKKNLATYCDAFNEKGYFDANDCRTILTEARKYGLKPKLHADELSSGGGAELAAELDAVSVDHLEHISDVGIRALAATGIVAVLLPGVSLFLNHQYAPARKLIDQGAVVAIATDFNPGSCMSYSMQLMMTLACTQMKMSPEETIVASTINSAAALNLSETAGSIEHGKNADLIVLDIPDYKFIPYHFGENHVWRTIKNGVILEF